eukprot:4044221-Alexandrium_andersonii.AAC.1
MTEAFSRAPLRRARAQIRRPPLVVPAGRPLPIWWPRAAVNKFRRLRDAPLGEKSLLRKAIGAFGPQ